MYVLVFWIKSKTISIVDETDLCPSKEEGEETMVKYENNRMYKAKIIRKSDDEEYLEFLKVTKDGEILRRGKNITSALASSEKQRLKEKQKLLNSKREKREIAKNNKLSLSSSIFSDDSDSEEIDDFEDQAPNNSSANEDLTSQSNEQSSSEVPLKRKNPNASEKDTSVPMKKTHSKIAVRSSNVEGNSSGASTSRSSNTENDRPIPASPALESNDPLVLCRQSGNGRVPLIEDCNIWICKGELMFIQRWHSDPNEMTRRLLRILVGDENLKNMCARGNSKIRPAVPKDILTCVEFYVNKRCDRKLKPQEFTDVVNLLCGTLRNPKK